MHDEAVRAIEGREFESTVASYPRTPEHHITHTRVKNPVGFGEWCTNEQIINPVSVHVPRRAHRDARTVISCDTIQDKAVRTIEGRELQGAAIVQIRTPEHHITRA